MSNAAKNLLLSQPKSGQTDGPSVITLPHKTHSTVSENGASLSVTEVEIPGVDPSTVEVLAEGNNITVSCGKGYATISLPQGTDTSKADADILWGVLTLTVPLPELPAPRSIKVNIKDAVKKAPTKFTSEE
jgi:HSP20 family molecular chaperone IbpA